ncbi:MAG TPA: hypothetical protein VFW40_13175 [Capsulimonadaceae bacterium]|nr:hypothetical protein [Capsulimonadaceae bacterium]
MKRTITMIFAGLFLAILLLASGCHHQAVAPAAPSAPSQNAATATPPIPPNAPSSEAQFLQNTNMPPAEKEAMIKQMEKQGKTGAH